MDPHPHTVVVVVLEVDTEMLELVAVWDFMDCSEVVGVILYTCLLLVLDIRVLC